MAKEYEFKVGDRVNVPQTKRPGKIVHICTEDKRNVYSYSGSPNIVTEYTVEVPFVNLEDTGCKYYTAKFVRNELTLYKSQQS